jgi:hypothetical protein
VNNKKVVKNLNLGASILFGLTTLLASLCGVVGFFIWLYRVWTDKSQFSWFGFFGILIVSFILFVIGIIILKSGVDEMKKP